MSSPCNNTSVTQRRDCSAPDPAWHTFADIWQRLQQEGIRIHPHQLAEFMVRHGLPVELRYVPDHLKPKAAMINASYQGDMARSEATQELPSLFPFE